MEGEGSGEYVVFVCLCVLKYMTTSGKYVQINTSQTMEVKQTQWLAYVTMPTINQQLCLREGGEDLVQFRVLVSVGSREYVQQSTSSTGGEELCACVCIL